MRNDVIEQVLEKRAVAIVRGVGGDAILPLAAALCEGGIGLVELTFDQSRPESFGGTAAAIKKLARQYAGRVLAGAGTVTTPGQVDMAADAGARYIISPDCCEAVIRRTLQRGLVSMPGAMTPTEILAAHKMGADFVKVFPAGVLGPGYIRALRGPIGHVRLLAVGGVDATNARDFLDAGADGVGAGGRLVDKTLVAEGRFDEIAAAARALAESVR